ncbi:MAG: (4Fe-4S)-binding protein [Melioribacteraceae bacterium]|nr:MAG: (4Fe-4S)-binding protein [Melioribacteraceae bacterium]
MSTRIAIASGKGGTGKTTVALNLFTILGDTIAEKIELVDCDVEEPNDQIFFKHAELESQENIYQIVPHIDEDLCIFCRNCVEYCEFNAIVVLPGVKFAEVNKSLCHSCGACSIACAQEAILEYPQKIGMVNSYGIKNQIKLKEGRLKIGSVMQTRLIKELKNRISGDSDIIIYDSPPGTSCPVVETISDTDYVILVTEPTLFGLHDLKLMVNLMKEVNIPYGVVVNKAGLGDNEVYDYLKNQKIDLLGEITFSKDYASIYAQGEIIENMPESIKYQYDHIIEKLMQKLEDD